MNKLTPQEINALLQFLQRVDLKGAEAPAFMQIVAKLQAMAMPPEPEEPKKE